MFDFILKPLGVILSSIYQFTNSYIVTLLIFAIIMKIVLFPLAIKQQKNSIKQASLRPREMAIRKKYAGRNDKATQTKMNEEVMQLYQSEHFNPASGCLPLLIIQFPILIALYNVVISPLTYILNFSGDQLSELREAVGPVLKTLVAKFDPQKATQNDLIRLITEHKGDLSDALSGLKDIPVDNIFNFYKQFDFFNVNLLKMPSFSDMSILILIPIITFIAAFISGKVVKKFSYQPNMENAGASMALMDWTMPLMSVYISFIVPSLIGIYWIFQNLLTMLQQYILYKLYPIPQITEEQIREAELQLKGKATKSAENRAVKEASAPAIAKAPLKNKKKNRLSLIQRKKGVNIEFKKRIRKSNIKPKALKKPKNNIA